MRNYKRGVVVGALLVFCLAATAPVWAHKMLISAVVEETGMVKVQSFFPDGTPAQEVPVVIHPGDGAPDLTAMTDNLGICRFPPLKPGSYRVEAGDPLGHRAETRLVVAGATPGAGSASPSKTVAAKDQAPPQEPLPWMAVLAGLGFIFGLSAFIMVLKLRAEVRRHAPRD